jgi:putative aminopeptidase FrvX
MNPHEKRALEILESLGNRPAAPFHEGGPASYLIEQAKSLGVDVRVDEFGNVIAHYQGASSENSQPPVAFVAHMDHPGYEIIEVGERGIIARALGGVPVVSMKQTVDVLALLPDGSRVTARLVPSEEPLSDDPDDRLVLVEFDVEVEFVPPVPLVFDLVNFSIDGDFIRMRAADDLAGCASTLAALERVVRDGTDVDFYAVWTRAEEGGLWGARLMAEAGTLPKDTLVVSIESSPVIPGVAQGDGPVIRTGDRMFTFDADAEQIFIVAQATLQEQNPEFKVQRQLMSGGSCEATAFAVFGYKATGMAFPLGNWHNATTYIGDPDGGIGAEYIHLQDFLGGVELLTEAAKSVGKRNDSPTRARVREIPDDIRTRMATTGAWE